MTSNTNKRAAALARSARAARAAGMDREQWAFYIDAGYYPLKWSCKFHALAGTADTQGTPNLILCGGGRGGAKSHTQWMQAVWDCHRYEGLTFRYLRKVGKSAKSKMGKLIKKTLSNIPHEWVPSDGVLYFPSRDDPNNSQMLVGYFSTESDIEVEQGDEFDGILLEEAAHLSERIVTLIFGQIRTTKGGWRARGYANANPGGVGTSWILENFVKPFENGRYGEFIGKTTAYFHSTYKDNPLLIKRDPDYVKYLLSLTGKLGQLWRVGDWHGAGGAFFTNFNEARHVVPPFPIPEHWKMWGSFDYGLSHPTAVYLLAKDPDTGNVYFVAEHYAAGLLPKQHAPRIRDMVTKQERQLSQLPPFAAGHDAFARGKDPKGGTIAEAYNKLGIRLKKANVARVEGAAKLARMLGSEGDENGRVEIAPTLYFFSTCTHLIEQMQRMESDPNRPEDVKKVNADEEGRGGDDAYDAGRYGIMEDVEKRKKRPSIGTVVVRAGY